MKTCKDCYFFECCSTLNPEFKKYSRDYIETDLCAKQCTKFKDKSRFVELPCKVGDEIFCTTMGRIYQGIVGRIELDDEGFNIITTDGYCFDSSICYHTQEEAEKAVNVKEREIND